MSAENQNGSDKRAKVVLWVGAAALAGLGIYYAFNPPHSRATDTLIDNKFPQTENTPLPGGETFIQNTPPAAPGIEVNGVIYSAEGTPFYVVPDPEKFGRMCAEISGTFQDIPGQRQDAGRLAQALGNGEIKFFRSGFPDVTIDTSADPFPSEVKMVHIGDIGCKNPPGFVDPSDY